MWYFSLNSPWIHPTSQVLSLLFEACVYIGRGDERQAPRINGWTKAWPRCSSFVIWVCFRPLRRRLIFPPPNGAVLCFLRCLSSVSHKEQNLAGRLVKYLILSKSGEKTLFFLPCLPHGSIWISINITEKMKGKFSFAKCLVFRLLVGFTNT